MENNNDKVMAIVAYILFLIPLVIVQNRSAFLNFHINQGLNLFIVGVVGSFALNFVSLYMVSNLWSLAVLVLAIMGIMSASKNEMKPLPIIGGLFNIIK
jgi:uncharacterized membrane protein